MYQIQALTRSNKNLQAFFLRRPKGMYSHPAGLSFIPRPMKAQQQNEKVKFFLLGRRALFPALRISNQSSHHAEKR